MPGTVVTMALLLNRLYGPLTALATARLDVVTALVSFERVFEVLDVEPLIKEPADPDAAARRPGVGGAARRALRLPGRRPGVAGVARGGRGARRPRRRRGAPRRVVPGRARTDRGPGRLVRRRQVDHRLAGAPPLRRRRRRGRAVGRRRARPVLRRHPVGASASSPRTATSSTTRSAPTSSTPRPDAADDDLWAALRQRPPRRG